MYYLINMKSHLSSLTLVIFYGLFTVSETTITNSVSSARYNTSDANDRNTNSVIHPGKVSRLLNGPEAGMSGNKFLYWSDEPYLYYTPTQYRMISEIICTRKSEGGRLVGLQAGYRVAYVSDNDYFTTFASYHGWTNWIGLKMISKSMNLDTRNGESIKLITYRTCGRHFDGIKIETNLKHFIECGNWDYTQAKNDKSCESGGGGTLAPAPGRKVIGLYGEAKGRAGSVEQGIRGLGLLTVPVH